ncbi:MAG: glutamate-5-semialdehyde dehydrogenase [Saprospiraceae bacterium]
MITYWSEIISTNWRISELVSCCVLTILQKCFYISGNLNLNEKMETKTVDTTAIIEALSNCRQASRRLQTLDTAQIDQVILKLADLTLEQTDFILAQNKKDLDRMDPSNFKYDRLLLTKERIQGIVADLRKVAGLPSPLGKKLEERELENGLHLSKVRVPLGVIGIVFESRPNVTFDVFALCLKSGNASVLKGSRDAHFSNIAIHKLIKAALSICDLENACYLAPSEREALGPILAAESYIDLIIPRGGQGLIRYVRKEAKVPVIETGAGIVHVYFDQSGDLEKGKAIITNAKSRRVSVCNALDTLLIHQDRLADLPALLKDLFEKHRCEVFADAPAYAQLQASAPKNLLHPASETEFGTEFLAMKMSVKTIPNIATALDHIDQYSSKHSEAIIAEDPVTLSQYLNSVDAAVVYANASTAFTDGSQFGLGAEIGISTQKMHARGPMALEELTSYKWIVKGAGQVRS